MGKIFALEKDLEVVAQTETLQQTLSAVSNTPAEVVLFEAGLSPNPPDAISEVIRRAQPGTKVIVVAHHTGEEETVEYLRRGVRGILTRSVSPDLLVRCVRKVAAGETWLDNQGVNWVIEAYRTQAEQGGTPKQQLRLSEKEMLIIGGVTQGLKNKDIALEVGTTEQVVKNYLRKIYDKLGVSDRLELALYSMHRRLLDGYVPPAAREILSSQPPNGTRGESARGFLRHGALVQRHCQETVSSPSAESLSFECSGLVPMRFGDCSLLSWRGRSGANSEAPRYNGESDSDAHEFVRARIGRHLSTEFL